jgi:hypothetical protein
MGSKRTKAQDTERTESIRHLRRMLKPGDNTSWSLGTERYYVGFVGPLRSGTRLVILP